MAFRDYTARETLSMPVKMTITCDAILFPQIGLCCKKSEAQKESKIDALRQFRFYMC